MNTKRLMKILLIVAACAALTLALTPVAGAEAGTTYYVATNGNDLWPGTLSQPWASIDHAAAVMGPGDTVLIRGGEYHEWVQTRRSGAASAPITFRAFPGERPILDGTGVGWNYGFNVAGDHSYIHIDGLVIRDFAGYGLTLWGNNRHVQIVNVEITNTDTALRLTEYGVPGGVVEDLRVENCYLHHNSLLGIDCSPGPCRRVQIINTTSAYNGPENQTAADGFAFESGEEIYVEQCRAIGNAGDGFDFKSDTTHIARSIAWGNDRDGIKLWGAGSTLENSIARDNYLTGVVLAEGGTYTLTNNIVAHNAVEIGNYGMYVAYDPPATADLRLFNNIFAFNGSSVYFGEHVSLTADHNIYYSREDSEIQAAFTARFDYSRDDINMGIWFQETGNGRYSGSVDPRFVDGAGRDYHSQPDSPAIDSGSNAWAPLVDFDGVRRPQGDFADIGAYEYIDQRPRARLPLLLK